MYWNKGRITYQLSFSTCFVVGLFKNEPTLGCVHATMVKQPLFHTKREHLNLKGHPCYNGKTDIIPYKEKRLNLKGHPPFNGKTDIIDYSIQCENTSTWKGIHASMVKQPFFHTKRNTSTWKNIHATMVKETLFNTMWWWVYSHVSCARSTYK